jgi:ubiquinone/menaquinone biosynthesis C-methylase UbiE
VKPASVTLITAVRSEDAAPDVNRRRYARIATLYDALDFPFEPRYKVGRGIVGRIAQERVLEVGAGTGKNFSSYSPAARVFACDLSSAMLNRARRRVRPAIHGLLVGDAHTLPIRDGCMDAVVATFVCCVQPDPRPALAELGRVLRPAGRAVFMEYVLPADPILREFLRLSQPLFHGLFGVHWRHNLAPLLEDAGLHVDEVQPVWPPLVECIVATRRQA